MKRSRLFLSLVVLLPARGSDSSGDLSLLRSWVEQAITALKVRYEHIELLLIEDGQTGLALKTLTDFPCVRILRLAQNYGTDIALSAGLERAIGDVVVTLRLGVDSIEDALSVAERTESTGAIVWGRDLGSLRSHSFEAKARNLFYRFTREALQLPILEHSSYLLGLSRQALNALLEIKDRTRHLRFLIAQTGLPQTPFDYSPSVAAERRSLFVLIEESLNVVVGHSLKPLRWVAMLGLLACLGNLIYIGYIFIVALIRDHVAEGWITLSFTNTVMFFGVFLILTVLSEYVGRILVEKTDRPLYFVTEEHHSQEWSMHSSRRNVVYSMDAAAPSGEEA